MGFADDVVGFGPLFGRGDRAFQIDLIYQRSDKVITICEIKYRDEMISTAIILEVERKASMASVPRGFAVEKALISIHRPDQHLRQSGYFGSMLTINDILG